MAKNQYDFTEGKIYKQLWRFSTPIILANLLQVSYQLVDSLWVGNLIGANALGSVAISATIIFTVLSFVIGMNNASLTILSQQRGRENEDGVQNYLNAFVVILTSLSIILGVLGYVFAEPILRLLGTPEAMMESARAYLRINFIGIFFLMGYNFIGTVLRAVGDSRTPLGFTLLAVICNVFLDPFFIAVLNLGVEGAAYATITSQGIAFTYGLSFMLKRNLVTFTRLQMPKKEEVTLILHLGIPSGLQMAVISAGIAAIMSVVTSFGEDVVAGFSAAQRLDSVLILPAHALGIAVNSMAGQNIGVKKWDRVKQIAVYGVLYNFCIMIVIALLLVLFARYGITLFIREEHSVEFGTEYLKIIAFFYPFLGINFALNGIVRAAGAMYQVLVLNVISFWILRYPLAYACSSLFGEKGIALGMGFSFVISSIIAFLYYRYGGWHNKVLFKEHE
ncbi:MATE family efflux transporter [Salirhabdus salicampi]|uniref:MATE family efflux transporter n=1 Tax=Salirhabdus salicampi TaxID=476102 RepID=UPI0020C42B8C|nr:MATE family efflux transporter [Salirhabdus salicampi]MCP8617315.1 MATE family efflux transporter [Salirhabdus salicampi]